MIQQRNYTTLSSIASGLNKVRWQGNSKFTARCPSHDDRNPSLSVTDKNGTILVYCFAGCSQDEVIGALRDAGLWHSASQYQIDRRKHIELKEDIRIHRQIYLVGIGQIKCGQALSEIDLSQLQKSIGFLREHANG